MDNIHIVGIIAVVFAVFYFVDWFIDYQRFCKKEQTND